MYQETGLILPKQIVTPDIPLGERIVAEALIWEGWPSIKYRGPDLGLTPEDGFDCSGFVVFVLQQTCVPLPRSVRHTNEFLDKYDDAILVHEDCAKSGDLIFFSKKGTAPNHLGFVIDSDWFIHAPGHNNTQVEVRKWITEPPAERVIYSRNPVAVNRIGRRDGPRGYWREQ